MENEEVENNNVGNGGKREKEGQKRGRKGYTGEGIGNTREGNGIQGGEQGMKWNGYLRRKKGKKEDERGVGKETDIIRGKVLIKGNVTKGE